MLKKFIPIAFFSFWIVPVAWVGLTRSNYPLYPLWIAPLFRVTGVFEAAPKRWRIFFIEVQDRGGWHCVDERSLFAPTPLGDRTRFQQLMTEIERSQPAEASKLLAWIAGHLKTASPAVVEPQTLRIIDFHLPPETFLRCASLNDAYGIAKAIGLPRLVIVSENIPPTHGKL